MTDVQDLKCGDMFVFRNERYIVLSSITDVRHTISNITAIKNWLAPEFYKIFVLSLFRTFEVEVIGHDDSFNIKCLENVSEEITQEQELKLQKERNL